MICKNHLRLFIVNPKIQEKISNIIQALRENNCKPRIPYPAKLSFNLNGEVRTLQNRDKLQQFTSTKLVLHKMHKGMFCTKEEKRDNHKHEKPGKNKTQKGNL
jgi:hypothetical protein